MNDDDKQNPDLAVETTYFPPARPGTATDSSDLPPDTVARVADSTLRGGTAAEEPAAVDSQLATIDLPPSAAPDGSTTSPTIDWSHKGGPQSPPKPKPAESFAGRQIGDYDVIGELGRGGMGVVYQARHRQLGRVVALKMIRAGAHADADDLDRFLSEAQAVARLQHPGIVQIFDIGQQDGLPYFSLEFVEGRSLLARIAKEPLEPSEAAALVEQIARAMQYAHDQGILHRDLKPANVLLTADGKPKITDFGLAKHLEEAASASTQTGSILGTPSYMSPEQAGGITKELTPATDQYSLGALLYHLLTGRPPFLAAKPVETVLQVLHEEPVPLRQLQPTVPVDLETICLKALQKDSQRRYATCDELAADLRRYLDGEPIVARPVGLPERLWRWCRRNPRVAIPTAASILLFLIAFGISAGSAWALAKLNKDLKQKTIVAQTNEAKAKAAEVEAKKQGKAATDHAGVALNTIARVFTKVQSTVGQTPQLQAFKRDLVQTAVADLDSIKGSIGTSGITGAATTLKYHEVMAQLHRDVGETEKAWSHLEQAHRIALRRIKDQNGSTAARLNLASVSRGMSSIRQEYKRDMQVSLKFANERASLIEDVLANPKPAMEEGLGLQIKFNELEPAYSGIGLIHIRLGDAEQALEYFERARQVRDGILADPAYKKRPAESRKKDEVGFRDKSAKSYFAIGELHHKSGRPEKGKEFFDKALEINRQLFAEFPNDRAAKQNLLGTSSQAGYWSFVSGKPEEARPLYEQALELAKQLDRTYPNHVATQTTLALMQYRMGVLKKSLADPTAEEHFDACLKLRAALATKDAANIKRHQEWMLALGRASKHQEAATLAEKLLATVKPPDIELLLDVARAYAQCSVAVAGDEAAAEAFRDKAVDAISQAVKQGHKDKVYLATEPDYVPLRDRDDFKALAAAEMK